MEMVRVFNYETEAIRRHSAEDMSPKKDHKRSRDTHPPGRSNFHSRAPAEAGKLAVSVEVT